MRTQWVSRRGTSCLEVTGSPALLGLGLGPNMEAKSPGLLAFFSFFGGGIFWVRTEEACSGGRRRGARIRKDWGGNGREGAGSERAEY